MVHLLVIIYLLFVNTLRYSDYSCLYVDTLNEQLPCIRCEKRGPCPGGSFYKLLIVTNILHKKTSTDR